MDGMSFFLRAVLLGGWVFIPAFIIALVMLRAPARAFWVSLVFSAGGALAFATAATLGLRHDAGNPLASLPDTLLGNSMVLLYCCAAAVGGGVLALLVFSKLIKTPSGERS